MSENYEDQSELDLNEGSLRRGVEAVKDTAQAVGDRFNRKLSPQERYVREVGRERRKFYRKRERDDEMLRSTLATERSVEKHGVLGGKAIKRMFKKEEIEQMDEGRRPPLNNFVDDAAGDKHQHEVSAMKKKLESQGHKFVGTSTYSADDSGGTHHETRIEYTHAKHGTPYQHIVRTRARRYGTNIGTEKNGPMNEDSNLQEISKDLALRAHAKASDVTSPRWNDKFSGADTKVLKKYGSSSGRDGEDAAEATARKLRGHIKRKFGPEAAERADRHDYMGGVAPEKTAAPKKKSFLGRLGLRKEESDLQQEEGMFDATKRAVRNKSNELIHDYDKVPDPTSVGNTLKGMRNVATGLGGAALRGLATDARRGVRKVFRKGVKEDMSVYTKDIIESIANQNRSKADIKEMVFAALSDRINGRLDECKAVIAENYFGQHNGYFKE
jgi:hypothetical protein